MSPASIPTIPPVALDSDPGLEQLIERASLDELCKGVFALFGIPIRIISEDGTVYGIVDAQFELCRFTCEDPQGRTLCRSTVDSVRKSVPGRSEKAPNASPADPLLHPCFTGLLYRIDPILYDGRRLGRIVIGPYSPASSLEFEQAKRDLLPTLDGEKFKALSARVPRAKAETVQRIAMHLRGALELILFHAHKASLTASAHLVSVRESFRELSEKADRLQAAYHRLKEVDRLKSSLLATVSHELKTPLTSILGYSEMLSEGLVGPLNDEQREYLRTIHDRGIHLLNMITGLLDMSKLELGTLSMKRTNGKPLELAREVATTMLPIAKKQNVTLLFECTEDKFETRFDPVRLGQVITNVVENAIKFTPDGGKVLISDQIVESFDGDDGDVGFALMAVPKKFYELRVLDNGVGIPEHLRDRIFDAFYQVDSSSTRGHGGTGLGLAIAKRVVEAHGGSIEARANEPQGTIFVIRIPAPDASRKSMPSVALFPSSLPPEGTDTGEPYP